MLNWQDTAYESSLELPIGRLEVHPLYKSIGNRDSGLRAYFILLADGQEGASFFSKEITAQPLEDAKLEALSLLASKITETLKLLNGDFETLIK